jgi:ATP diphosphatase
MNHELEGLRLNARQDTVQALAKAAAIMARLRGPDGCPWDREQTFDSIKRHTLEETYEVFDAIERRAWPELKDELGDLLLQVLFYAQMAEEAGYFTLRDVAENLNAKLIRRHPHIFPAESGELVVATDADEVLRNWEQIKLEEKKAKPANAGLLDDVPRSMPAMLEASKLGSMASKVGFDWPDATGLFAKLDEEIAELMVEVEAGDRAKVETEFGDLIFTAMNLARHLGVDAESALRGTNAKFRRRFAAMEQAAGEGGLADVGIDELEALWVGAKASEVKAGLSMEHEIRIESLTELEQFDRCVALQDAVWGYDSTASMSQKVFLLAAHIGGQVLGAFEGEALVGYAMSLPGVRGGYAYLHSHHLAVLPAWRNFGVGRRLKLAQRDEALARGIDLMEWTFDPLEIKNSYLNFARLGAISRRYERDFYGPSSSPLHGGLPTDRIVAEWWLKSDRVLRVLGGDVVEMEVLETVGVPMDVSAWKGSEVDRVKARALQEANAMALEGAFGRGLSVIGYERDARGDGRFLLGVADVPAY